MTPAVRTRWMSPHPIAAPALRALRPYPMAMAPHAPPSLNGLSGVHRTRDDIRRDFDWASEHQEGLLPDQHRVDLIGSQAAARSRPDNRTNEMVRISPTSSISLFDRAGGKRTRPESRPYRILAYGLNDKVPGSLGGDQGLRCRRQSTFGSGRHARNAAARHLRRPDR